MTMDLSDELAELNNKAMPAIGLSGKTIASPQSFQDGYAAGIMDVKGAYERKLCRFAEDHDPVLLIPFNTDQAPPQAQLNKLREAIPGYRVIFVAGMSGSAIIIPPITNNNKAKETQQP